MSAMSHEFDLAQAKQLPPHGAQVAAKDAQAALTARWEAVHEAAAAVAVLARINAGQPAGDITALPERAAAADGWVFEMVTRGVDDLAAVLQSGLRALLALTAQGRDARAAALALWNEFERARTALQVLVVAR